MAIISPLKVAALATVPPLNVPALIQLVPVPVELNICPLVPASPLVSSNFSFSCYSVDNLLFSAFCYAEVEFIFWPSASTFTLGV